MKLVIASMLAVAGLSSCSSSSSGNDAGVTVNGCDTFTDATSGSATVNGPTGATPAQYSPNCVHIKTGQTVTFALDFTDHPMQPFGGDTPSPILETTSGTSVQFTFANAGTFGFQCEAHPGTMHGAIQVTP